MRLIVDKMASERLECPYIQKFDDEDKYHCKFNATTVEQELPRLLTECKCDNDDMSKCPYFVGLSDALYDCSEELENILDGCFEKVPYDTRGGEW